MKFGTSFDGSEVVITGIPAFAKLKIVSFS